ncbi:MAG: hypothetical protein ACLR1T_09440 [Evtepia gabavorous]
MRFSFLLSIPAVLGANILSIGEAVQEGIDVSLLPAYIVGHPGGGRVRLFCHSFGESAG